MHLAIAALKSGSTTRALVWPFVLALFGFSLAPTSEIGRDLLAIDASSRQGLAMMVSVVAALLALQAITLTGLLHRFSRSKMPKSGLVWAAVCVFGLVILPAGCARFGQELYDVLFVQGQPSSGIYFDALWFGTAVTFYGFLLFRWRSREIF